MQKNIRLQKRNDEHCYIATYICRLFAQTWYLIGKVWTPADCCTADVKLFGLMKIKLYRLTYLTTTRAGACLECYTVHCGIECVHSITVTLWLLCLVPCPFLSCDSMFVMWSCHSHLLIVRSLFTGVPCLVISQCI